MRLIAFAVLASTALVPASALAQGTDGQSQSNQAAQTSQARQVAVSDLDGLEVYTAQGQSIGQIDSVVMGQNNQPYAVVSFDEFLNLGDDSRLVPLSRMTLQNDRALISSMNDSDFKSLQTYQPDMAGFREADQSQQVALGAQNQNQQQAQNQSGQSGSRIVVQRSAPSIRVDQAQPRVTVRQPPPQVTVNQAQPEIIVRQPQPTVRVDIPQPEIIVRMPKPDVNVAMAQPQVQVQQPQPQVQVVQPQQQPQVQVERAQPQVMVQRQANAEPNVQVKQAPGQPTVRYERAQPRVIVNQAQGQPNVRIERQDNNQQANAQNQQGQKQQAAAQTSQAQSQAGTGSARSAEERQALRERINAGDVESTGAVNANTPMRPIAVSQLEDMDVYNARGDDLGEVDRVIVTPEGRKYLVVASGGFLGIGEDHVAFPIERFWMKGDRLVIRGVSEDDIDAMDDYRDTVDNFQRLGSNDQENLRIWQ